MKWTEDSRLMFTQYTMQVPDEGGVHNLFMLQRFIERVMVKVRKDYIFVALGNMEKAYYDRMNREKLFELIRGYGVQETIVGLI